MHPVAYYRHSVLSVFLSVFDFLSCVAVVSLCFCILSINAVCIGLRVLPWGEINTHVYLKCANTLKGTKGLSNVTLHNTFIVVVVCSMLTFNDIEATHSDKDCKWISNVCCKPDGRHKNSVKWPSKVTLSDTSKLCRLRLMTLVSTLGDIFSRKRPAVRPIHTEKMRNYYSGYSDCLRISTKYNNSKSNFNDPCFNFAITSVNVHRF